MAAITWIAKEQEPLPDPPNTSRGGNQEKLPGGKQAKSEVWVGVPPDQEWRNDQRKENIKIQKPCARREGRKSKQTKRKG